MPTSYNVVGLVSGGKDSVFNLMECVALGHRIVAVANLKPAQRATVDGGGDSDGGDGDSDGGDGVQELDSFMFQTVGHTAIEALAEALGVPLVRRSFHGRAVAQGLQYMTPADAATTTGDAAGAGAGAGAGERTGDAAGDGDEVEDLYALLADVKRLHPTVNAVSCGAILSTYQRNRVENVCGRLGLVSLAYLWQRSQPRLLQRMLDSGLEAVLCKVASIGLSTRHVGKSLGQMHPVLTRAAAEYGVNVCGEGGEYETLTLDSPLFSRRIVLDEAVTHVHSDDAFAPVAYLVVRKCHTEAKDVSGGTDGAGSGTGDGASTPSGARSSAGADSSAAAAPPPAAPVRAATLAITFTDIQRARGDTTAQPGVKACVCDTTIHLAGITAASEPGTAPEQTRRAMDAMRAAIEAEGAAMPDVAFVHLYLADMSQFASVNAVYCEYFGVNPPSRSCVQVALADGVAVMVDCLAVRGSGKAAAAGVGSTRSTLHVQSISRWAPVCIGPYCQANQTGGLLFLAGQIGLVPETMDLVTGGAGAELELALRNCARVLDAVDSDARLVVNGVLYVAAGSSGEASALASVCHEWLRTGGAFVLSSSSAGAAAAVAEETDDDEGTGFGDGDDDASSVASFVRSSKVDDVASAHTGWGAQLLVVGVPQLPRGAAVEWEVQALTMAASTCLVASVELPPGDAVGDGLTVSCGATYVPLCLCDALATVTLDVTGSADHSDGTTPLATTLEAVAAAVADGLVSCLQAARMRWSQVLHLRVYVVRGIVPAGAFDAAVQAALQATAMAGASASAAAGAKRRAVATTVVPVESLGSDGSGVAAVSLHAFEELKLETETWLRTREDS